MNGKREFCKTIFIKLGIICLFVSRGYAAEGLWQENGVVICNAAGDQEYPRLMSDGAGGAIISWSDYRSNNTRDIYCQRINSSGTPQWAANGAVICNAAGDQCSPQLVLNDADGAFITWSDWRSSDYDIYCQCINSFGNIQWAANGIVICGMAGDQYSSQLVRDGSGGAIIVWQDARNPYYDDIYGQRINSSGEPQWAANGAVICNATGAQRSPKLIADGMGGAIIAWYDNRGGNNDIYCQRINNSGEPQWTANGVVICNAVGDQYNAQLIPDGAGGAMITWYDTRNGIADIYCQRINSSGEPQWTPNGVGICNTAYYQASPQLIPDGTGGAIIIWEDSRNGVHSIFCQHINSSGEPQWAADGVMLGNATGDQLSPQLVSDKAGGAMITWDNENGGCHDIYCQRINGSGELQWATSGVKICNTAWGLTSPQITSDGAGGCFITWEDWRSNNRDICCQRMLRPHPQALTINSPAIPGTLFHAAITGNWFVDDHGSVVIAKLTRAASAEILFSTGTLNVMDANHLTCDFDLSSTLPGDWSLILVDNLSQSSSGAVVLAVATLTPVPTATPTLTPTSTPTSVPGTRTIAVDHYLFITHPNDGLKIYDISDPSHPQLVYSISGSRRIYIKDHYLYMVDGQGMLYVDDIHDPGIPKELCRRQTGGEANGIDGTGNYVLVADGQNGVAVFDIAMVNDICLKDRLQTRGNARDVRIAANEKRVYVIWPDGSQWSFDISRYLDSPTLGDGGYATPNPFLPLLGQKAFFNFRFEEPNAVYAVRIYNLRGRLQRTLTNTREWDGRNESGHLCEGGVYVYQIEAEGKRVNGKVVLLK